MKARPTQLIYRGQLVATTVDADGNPGGFAPDRFFHGVPARDLDETDIARLSDDELKDIMGGKEPLYVDPGKAESEKAEAPTEKKAVDKKP